MLAMLNTTIAHYKITAKLGEGGMGAVYRATDTKLAREVAIKVLPEAFAQDKERLARFEREAKALAQLNHPNVGSIFGFDQDEGHYFLVLELIEGDTLQERLRKGPLPVEEGLKVFQQIAEALEAAHEKDIVHRDLKPANLKIDPHGRVKVLDFGLAKARFSDPGSDNPGSSSADSMAPTITSEFTMPGKVMGTAAYMSPEQSRGQEVDRRTDVWAFGCCLYEALTGKKPFTGATTSDLLADILKSDPDFTVVPPETPSEVLTLLRRSLEKDPRRRLRDLGDIALTLEDVTETSRIQSSRIIQMDATSVHRQPLVEPAWKRLLSIGKTVGNIVLALGFSYAVWTLVFDREKPAARSAIRSIAVLPFSFSGSDTNVSDVAEWLPHDIQGTLVSVDVFDLVPAWSLSSAYSAETKPAAAAADLKVQAVVQGLVRVQGNEITVNLELIDGASGQQLWNGSFPIKGGDIEGLKMEIVQQLLRESLQRPLSLEERARLGTPKKVNAQAYIAFQQGVKYFDQYTRDGFEKAEAKFDEAIEIDPSFGAPYAFRIYNIWVPTVWGGTTISAAEAFGRASSLLEESRPFLKPEDIFRLEGWNAMVGRWDWPEANAAFERAMETGDRSAESFLYYADYLRLVEARYGDALRMIKRAMELDPDRFNNLNVLAQVYIAGGEYRLAIEQYDQVPDLPWAYLRSQSEAYAELGELEEALNLIRQAEELSEQNVRIIMVKASIFAEMGRAAEARLLMDKIRSKRDAGLYIPEAWFAPVYYHLGEMEQALRSIEDGFGQKGSWKMVELRFDQNLKMFSDEPRYWAVVEKMNFPALPISHPFHDKEQEMRYGKGLNTTQTNESSASEDASIRKIAVLPFRSIAGVGDHESYYAAAITELISLELGKIKALRMTGNTSATRFKDSDHSIPEIARELGVDALIKGTVIHLGDDVLITASLWDGESGESLWGDDFPGTKEGLPSLKSQVILEIAKRIKANLTPEQSANLVKQDRVNRKAYDAYLRGLAEKSYTEEGKLRSLAFAEAAIAADSEFELPYLLKARVLTDIIYWGFEGSEDGAENVKTAMKRALDIAPDLAEAHALMGVWELYYNRNLDAAESSLKLALKGNPNLGTAYISYSMLAGIQHEDERAIGYAKTAMELDPFEPMHAFHLAWAYFRSGDYEKALEAGRRNIEVDPSSFTGYHASAFSQIAMGRDKEAKENLQRAFEKSDRAPFYLARRGYALGVLGEKAEARKMLDQLEAAAVSKMDRVTAFHIGLVCMGLGDDDKAIEQFEKAIEERDMGLIALGSNFYFDSNRQPLKDNPKYKPLLRKIGLPE